MKLIGVYGVSGFGREVMPLVRQAASREFGDGTWEAVFVDDRPADERVNDHRVLTLDAFVGGTFNERLISIAIADSEVRSRLSAKCAESGVKFMTVQAPTAVILDDNHIGEGAILCSFVNITSNARIGRHFHANIYSYVAHDCVIGDFVTFAPAVKCNGNVRIDDHAYIGTGAILKQGRPGDPLVIGSGAIVGMGAVVTKSVPPGTTVVGNPARPLVK